MVDSYPNTSALIPNELHTLFASIDDSANVQQASIEKLVAIAHRGSPREEYDELWPLVIQAEGISTELVRQHRAAIALLMQYAPDAMTGAAWFLATAHFSGRISVQALKNAVDPLYDKSEKNMQKIFKEHIDYFLGEDAKVVNPPSSYKHRDIEPDAWITLQGELCVVEMKRTRFTARAKHQLLDYMETFDCKRGIAVAPLLDIRLPRTIQFVRFDWDDVRDGCFTYYTLDTLTRAYEEATRQLSFLAGRRA